MTLRKKIFAAAAFALLLSLVLVISVFAKGEACLIDEADMIKDHAIILSAIEAFEENTGIDLYIVTNYNYKAEPYEFGISSAEDALILIIEYGVGENFYEPFKYGKAHDAISSSESDRILDDPTVYEQIKFGDVDAGVLRFIELAETAYLGVLQESVLRTVIISLVLAVIFAAVPIIIIVVKYKRKAKGSSYPLERYASLYLHDDKCRDTFIGSFVTRTRISTSSGSRSGGGSRGGGSRGGSMGRR